MTISRDSSKRLKRIWKRREKALTSWEGPPEARLPSDSVFPPASFGDLVTDERAVTTWKEFQEWVLALGSKWSFRGQGKENWRLIPGLERSIVRRCSASSSDGKKRIVQVGMFPGTHEYSLFQRFQKMNHRRGDPLAIDGALDTLALMQHHGAPTRLLDWTRSPYVALFFALRKAGTESAVWAVDMEWLEHTSTEILRNHDSGYPGSSDPAALMRYVNGILFKEHTQWNDHPVVTSLTPVASIERMQRQEGHFLRSLSYHQPFDVSLYWMIRSKFARPWVPNRPLRKLIVAPCQRTAFLKELRRMNVYDDYLFPGSDFAYDLRAELETRVRDDGRQWTKSISKLLDGKVRDARAATR